MVNHASAVGWDAKLRINLLAGPLGNEYYSGGMLGGFTN
jgi:hypothetical protein